MASIVRRWPRAAPPARPAQSHPQPILKALPFAFAAALVAVAVPTQAQTVEHQIRREPKLAYTMQQTPTFNVSGPKDKRVTPLEWLEVEVEIDVETVRKSGFLDELTGTFRVRLVTEE